MYTIFNKTNDISGRGSISTAHFVRPSDRTDFFLGAYRSSEHLFRRNHGHEARVMYNLNQGRRTKIDQRWGRITWPCTREARAKIPIPLGKIFAPLWAYFFTFFSFQRLWFQSYSTGNSLLFMNHTTLLYLAEISQPNKCANSNNMNKEWGEGVEGVVGRRDMGGG